MNRFERLSRLSGYTVDKHQPDPRGWDIVNSDHRRIGEVKDLIVDTPTMKATYLDVLLDTKLFDTCGDPHVLIPFERAERHGSHKDLVVSGLDSAAVQQLCSDRAQHQYDFWERWWERGTTATASSWSPTISQQLSTEDLRRALETARPGEQVRIPIVNEEIIIERRPLHRDDPTVLPTGDDRTVVTQHVK
jgi:hypothetical protein